MILRETFEGYPEFLESLKNRVSTAQLRAVRKVNQELIYLYWQMGRDILKKQKDLGWGAKVIDHLSNDLSITFPAIKGFSTRNLKYMRRFAEVYPDEQFVQQVVAQLPWGHNVFLLDKVKDETERLWYMNTALEYGWSRDVMVHHIELNLYKREGKAINNFSDKLPDSQSDLANQSLKNPYLFNFLSIGQEAHERELEKELTKHIQKFLLELGVGFAFLGSQYPIEISGENYYIDLLFYHVKLHCYVAIELKAAKFVPADVGQIGFYLTALDNQVKGPQDNPSMGLILCKSKDKVVGEYAIQSCSKPLGLAEYKIIESIPEELKTSLPTIEEIEEELSKA